MHGRTIALCIGTAALAISVAVIAPRPAIADPPAPRDAGPQTAPQTARPGHHPSADRSGRVQQGKASHYGRDAAGKKMADGNRLQPDSNAAASKTLPLGTTAKVTNLENGKSATVQVQDRGPYVPGRILDVTPKVADQLDMKRDGVAPVAVTPLVIPSADDKSPAH